MLRGAFVGADAPEEDAKDGYGNGDSVGQDGQAG